MYNPHLLSFVLFTLFVCTHSQILNLLRPKEFHDTIVEVSDGPLEYSHDATLTTIQIARRYGYLAEAHVIRTADGYLLTLHRIPCNKNCKKDGSKISRQPVLLQHGLFSSSAVWVTSGPESSFAFMLAEAGYDVWLGNLRGSTDSDKHINLSTDPRSSYWNYSWHEMGMYDLPAQIDYIETHKAAEGYRRRNNLIYIGHSMGTTAAFVLLSVRPEYNRKLTAVIALAPLMHMRHAITPLRALTTLPDDTLTGLFGGGVVATEYLPTKRFTSNACLVTRTEKDMCHNILFAIAGYDKTKFNESLYPVILAHTPAHTSSKTMIHYIQEMRAGPQKGNFRRYDYGLMENNKRYRRPLSPNYDVSKIKAPVALLYGDADLLSATLDVLRAGTTLPNVIEVYNVPDRNFHHLDFLWANNAPELVYKKVLNIIRRYR